MNDADTTGPVTAVRPTGEGGTARVADDLSIDVQRELQRFATEFLVLVSPKGEIVTASQLTPLGYEADERAGRHIAEHLHPDDLPGIYELIERARRTPGFHEQVRARARHRDGSWRVFEAEVFDAGLRSNLQGAVLRVREAAGEPPAPAGPSRDRFASLAEMLPLGILSADARGWVVYANEIAGEILGVLPDDLHGQGWQDAVLDADRRAVDDVLAAVEASPGTRTVMFRLRGPGLTRWIHATFASTAGDGTDVVGWLATIEDVTERQGAQRRLAYQATHDPLTGLPNRTLLEDRLTRAIGRLRRESTSVTVLFVDLDGFKSINDRLGHKTGDLVLQEVAVRLRRVVRAVDTVARLGGDEFVAVCESLPLGEDERIAARVAESLVQPIVGSAGYVTVGASVGLATTSDPDVDLTDLVELADQAMYRVKAAKGPTRG